MLIKTVEKDNIQELKESLYFCCKITRVGMKVFKLLQPQKIEVFQYPRGGALCIYKDSRHLVVYTVLNPQMKGVITENGVYVDLLHNIDSAKQKLEDLFNKLS